MAIPTHPGWGAGGSQAAYSCHSCEAGLRFFNRRMPEEINRGLTDRVSPVRPSADKVKALEPEILTKYGLVSKSYYLATVHRAENTDAHERLSSIVQAFNELATAGCPLVIPLHPRTAKRMEAFGLVLVPQVRVLPPVSYLEMVALERNAKVILTDSGGVQKEAFFHRVPCVTLREETEWVETVDGGGNCLAGSQPGCIVRLARQCHFPVLGNASVDSRAAQYILTGLHAWLLLVHSLRNHDSGGLADA